MEMTTIEILRNEVAMKFLDKQLEYQSRKKSLSEDELDRARTNIIMFLADIGHVQKILHYKSFLSKITACFCASIIEENVKMRTQPIDDNTPELAGDTILVDFKNPFSKDDQIERYKKDSLNAVAKAVSESGKLYLILASRVEQIKSAAAEISNIVGIYKKHKLNLSPLLGTHIVMHSPFKISTVKELENLFSQFNHHAEFGLSMFEIIMIETASKHNWDVAELAKHLKVTRKTAYKKKEIFETLCAPIADGIKAWLAMFEEYRFSERDFDTEWEKSFDNFQNKILPEIHSLKFVR